VSTVKARWAARPRPGLPGRHGIEQHTGLGHVPGPTWSASDLDSHSLKIRPGDGAD
jgi:hypothetical protein